MGGINVYITKIINTYGSSEMIAQAIDDLSNEMYKDGYELVTYQFYAFNEKILVTFKKIDS